MKTSNRETLNQDLITVANDGDTTKGDSMNAWISFYLGCGHSVHCLVSQETYTRFEQGEFYDFYGGAEDEEQYRLDIPQHLFLDEEKSFCQETFDKEENDLLEEEYEYLFKG